MRELREDLQAVHARLALLEERSCSRSGTPDPAANASGTGVLQSSCRGESLSLTTGLKSCSGLQVDASAIGGQRVCSA